MQLLLARSREVQDEVDFYFVELESLEGNGKILLSKRFIDRR